MTLTTRDERLLAGISLAATRPRLERVAERVLDRDDAVTELLRRATATDADGGEAWQEIVEILERRGGSRFSALDLLVEMTQVERVRRGEPRTWSWPRQYPEKTPLPTR